MTKNQRLVINRAFISIKNIPLFLLLCYSLYKPVMVHAQKIMDGIYFAEFDGESTDFELIRFKSNQAFTNFHGKKSGNELGKGLYHMGKDTLTMEFEEAKGV